jgi:hypothetical protein
VTSFLAVSFINFHKYYRYWSSLGNSQKQESAEGGH